MRWFVLCISSVTSRSGYEQLCARMSFGSDEHCTRALATLRQPSVQLAIDASLSCGMGAPRPVGSSRDPPPLPAIAASTAIAAKADERVAQEVPWGRHVHLDPVRQGVWMLTSIITFEKVTLKGEWELVRGDEDDAVLLYCLPSGEVEEHQVAEFSAALSSRTRMASSTTPSMVGSSAFAQRLADSSEHGSSCAIRPRARCSRRWRSCSSDPGQQARESIGT